MQESIGEVHVLENLELDLSLDRILDTPPFPTWRESKYSRERLEEPVERLRTEVRQAVDPRGMYRIRPTDQTDIRAYDPPNPVTEAAYVCSLLVTVGDCGSARPESEPLFDEMVRDAIENAVLTITKETIAIHIRDRATDEEGWNTTRLFSPGSGNVDWSVENSRFVFETLPAEEISVSLADNGLIRPNKSVSGVLGVGPDIEHAPELFTCEGCPRIPDCPYAKTPWAEKGVS